jgi:hypothetical protein
LHFDNEEGCTFVPRRPKHAIETIQLETEFPELFGELGGERDLDGWFSWLKKTAPDVAARIDDLIRAGCDRRIVLRYLCELHASRRWNSFSQAELKASRDAIAKAERVVATLAASELRYHLLLARWDPEKRPRLNSLGLDLAMLARRIEMLPIRTNRRESLLRNELLAYLTNYVEWATRAPHDEELEPILAFVIGRTPRAEGEFSIKHWRIAHKGFWTPEQVSTIKRKWARAAVRGVIQEPPWKSRQLRGG